MRRMYPLLLAAVLLSGTVALLAQTPKPEPTAPDPEPILVEPPPDWIVSALSVDELEALPEAPFETDAGPASDTCAAATDLELTFTQPADGSATLINTFTEEVGDPNLWCTWGEPSRPQGYRTAWFRLVARDTGQVTLTTRGTDYDTILAVYSGQCQSLLQLACNDDYLSLQSEVTFEAVRNRTYYIEVADYQRDLEGPTTLRFSAVIGALPSRWQQMGTMPFGGVSRHALAHTDRYIYIIGGQERILGIPTLTNRLLRFDGFEARWSVLSNMPGQGLSDTTAVQVGGRIYVPGGFDGNTTSYSSAHWVYDINADLWFEAASIPTNLLPGGKPFAWAKAVAPPGAPYYYLTGGLTTQIPLDAAAGVISNTYRYTPATSTWEAMQPMTLGRYGHTGVWLEQGNKGLCIVGGLSVGDDPDGDPIAILLTGGECLDPATGTWTPVAPLNFPRYNADSAIGPDGSWYVFGGLDASGAVAETEVYDAASNTWRLLDSGYRLGGLPKEPARAWPRGAFIGNNLWVFGGNDFPERRTISSYEILRLGQSAGARLPFQMMLPLSAMDAETNFLDQAAPIGEGGTASSNFQFPKQFFHAYFFDWAVFGRVTATLSDIPNDSNFNVWLFDGRKRFIGRGDPATYGGIKTVSRTLMPGRYYILVERIFPKDVPDVRDFYRLNLRREPGTN